MMHYQNVEGKGSFFAVDLYEEEGPAVELIASNRIAPQEQELTSDAKSGCIKYEIEYSNVTGEKKAIFHREELEQLHACPECGRNFSSEKSVYGHLKVHKERPYRGSKPPPRGNSQDLPKWLVRGKRARRDRSVDLELLEGAVSLLVLSHSPCEDGPAMNMQLKTEREGGKEEELPKKKKIRVEEFVPELNSNVTRRDYRCRICSKSFRSRQALGGHKASHGKNRNNLEGKGGSDHLKCTMTRAAATNKYRCTECNEEFLTGQALGGHKRKHYIEKIQSRQPAISSVIAEKPKPVVIDLDLNKPAPEA